VSSIGHTQNGFKNSAIAIRVMRTGLKACNTYMRSDAEIAQYALLSIGTTVPKQCNIIIQSQVYVLYVCK
jgi:hypothetical protein